MEIEQRDLPSEKSGHQITSALQCYPSSNVNDAGASQGSNTFLATEPATLGLRRCALTIVIVLFVLFCALIPFARLPLPRFEAFIPISEAALALVGLLTTSFLLVAFRRSRLGAVLCLASGYLFTLLMAVPLVLTSVGVFWSGRLLGADPQTNALLDVVRDAGFPAFVICYALRRRYEGLSGRLHTGRRADIVWATAGTLAGVSLLTLFATVGHQL